MKHVKTSNFLAIIRHGERADNAGYKIGDLNAKVLNWDNKIDPPLTVAG